MRGDISWHSTLKLKAVKAELFDEWRSVSPLLPLSSGSVEKWCPPGKRCHHVCAPARR